MTAVSKEQNSNFLLHLIVGLVYHKGKQIYRKFSEISTALGI